LAALAAFTSASQGGEEIFDGLSLPDEGLSQERLHEARTSAELVHALSCRTKPGANPSDNHLSIHPFLAFWLPSVRAHPLARYLPNATNPSLGRRLVMRRATVCGACFSRE
jgi:hypothetical protein